MEFIKYETEGAVGILTIDRPKALNALNSDVLNELDQAIDAIDLNAVRALIVTGAGEKSFVAGADIAEMSELTKAQGEAFGKHGNDIFRKLETLPIPVIAAVNGFALGGGCELAMSCDIRLCSENAMLGISHFVFFFHSCGIHFVSGNFSIRNFSIAVSINGFEIF